MQKTLKTMMVAALAALGMGVLMGAPVSADGGNSLRISPSGTRLTLDAGKVLEGTDDGCVASGLSDGCWVNVQNMGEKSFRYKIYVSPYVVTGSDNALSFADDAGTAYTQISRWITVKNSAGEYVEEATFSIEPGETQKIEYRVTIPDDIPGGSQYAVIWAQILSEDENVSGIQTIGQLGSVITGRSTGESVEKAAIYDVKMKRFALSGPLTASARVNNEGNTDFVVKYSYKASTFFGKEVYSVSDTLAAYPETDYAVETTWENTPWLGIFQVEFTVSGADQAIMEKHIVIIMPILVMILLILLLTIVIVWIIIVIRKRKERQARKLV